MATPFRSGAGKFAAWYNERQIYRSDVTKLEEENAALKKKIADMEEAIRQAENDSDENRRLREWLGLREQRRDLSDLETALITGDSPALIIFDHADRPTDMNIAFSKRLHNSIPESWIVEIVPDTMPIEKEDDSLYWIRRPLTEDEWRETLDQVLRKTPTPQWANT